MSDFLSTNNEDDSNYVSLKELVLLLWTRKFFIIFIVTIFAILSVIIALSIPNKYISQSNLRIVEESAKSSMGGISSQYSDIASMAGINLPADNEKSKAQLAIETLKSRDFLSHLITFDDVLPNLMAAKRFDIESKSTIFDPKIYDAEKKLWVRTPKNNQKVIPSYLETHEDYIKDIISISYDRKTGFIKISVEHISPYFAYSFLSLVISELNNVSRIRDLEKADKSVKYLNDQLSLFQQADIKKSINLLIERQFEVKMLANTRDDYLITPLDRPFVPEKKSSPSRSIICIAITLFGFLLSAGWVLFTNYFLRNLK